MVTTITIIVTTTTTITAETVTDAGVVGG